MRVSRSCIFLLRLEPSGYFQIRLFVARSANDPSKYTEYRRGCLLHQSTTQGANPIIIGLTINHPSLWCRCTYHNEVYWLGLFEYISHTQNFLTYCNSPQQISSIKTRPPGLRRDLTFFKVSCILHVACSTWKYAVSIYSLLNTKNRLTLDAITKSKLASSTS